jgi:hypothetical protein
MAIQNSSIPRRQRLTGRSTEKTRFLYGKGNENKYLISPHQTYANIT